MSKNAAWERRFSCKCSGPISDKLGRKKGAVIFGALSALSFSAFAFGTPYIQNGTAGAIIAGVLFGISISS